MVAKVVGSTPTPRDRGLAIALDLQRRADPKTWRAQVDAIEDLEVRGVADEYLRAIIVRTRVVAMKKREQNRGP